QPPQPPQPPQSRIKTKVLLKKSKKPKSQADTDVIQKSLTKIETKVEAMSMFNLSEAIDKSVQAYLKNTLSKDTEIRHDDRDPPTDDDKESKMRKRKDSDETLSKKSKDEDKSSKEGKAPSKYDEAVDAEETIQADAMDDEQVNEDDLVDTQDDIAPTRDRSKWFKQDAVVRPETPNPKWHKEPNANDAPEQNWFNYMVNIEKDPFTFDDLMGSTIDFIKFAKQCLQKDKIIKVDLKGRTFKLLKGNYRNYIELEYIMEQCYLDVTDQMDWANPKDDRYPYDLSKPLPLQGPHGQTTIPMDFFNKDMKISIDKQFGYRYLKEIMVRRADQKGIILKKRLEDVQLGVESYQTKLNSTRPQVRCDDLKAKEPYTILYKHIGVVSEQEQRLYNFELGYNAGMLKRAWTEKDQKRIASMLDKIDQTLLTRSIIRSLECFVGGRRIEMDYRLLTTTIKSHRNWSK
nr:hypothetical protein [Tanacetum cinerariifolium]